MRRRSWGTLLGIAVMVAAAIAGATGGAGAAGACDPDPDDPATIVCTGTVTGGFDASGAGLPEELTIIVTEGTTVDGDISYVVNDTVINRGTIQGTVGAGGWSETGDVVWVTVINEASGRIESSWDKAITFTADELSIANHGEIVVSQDTDAVPAWATGIDAYRFPLDTPVSAVFDIQNTGSINASASASSGWGAHALGIAVGTYEVEQQQVRITNDGDIVASATSEYDASAVGVGAALMLDVVTPAGAAEIGNAGSITVSASAPGSEAYGLRALSHELTVTNAGDIVASATSTAEDGYAEANGVWAGGDVVDIRNAGHIGVTAGGTGPSSGSQGWGVYVDGDSSPSEVRVTNEGDIAVAATGPAESESTATGIDARLLVNPSPTDSVSIANSGTINVTASGGAGAYGLHVWAPTVTITNSGVISATATDGGTGTGIEICLPPPDFSISVTTIDNSGTVTGSTWAILGRDGQERVTNSGRLEGDVDLGGGDDQFTVTATGVVTGDVHLGPGNDAATLEAGAQLAGVLDGGEGTDALTLTARAGEEDRQGQVAMTGFETVDFQAGRWLLQGPGGGAELNLGNVTVASGSLFEVAGGTTVVGNFVVDGTLSGTGTVKGDVTLNGTLAPGHSPGTLTVVGDYTHGADAVYEVEVSPEGAWDLLEVKDDPGTADEEGHAELQGGTVRVYWPTEGWPKRTGPRPILTAENGVTGTFDRVEAAWDAPFLRPLLSYTANEVLLTIERALMLAEVALTPNQRAVARVLDAAAEDPDTGLGPVLQFLLTDATEEQARRVFDALSGEVYASYPVTAAAAVSQFLEGAARGRQAASAGEDGQKGRRGWLYGFGRWGTLLRDEEQGTAPAAHQLAGLAGGAAWRQGPGLELGWLAGLGRNLLRMPERESQAQAAGYQLGLYGRWALGRARLAGTVVYGWEDVDVARQIRFGAEAREARGEFRATAVATDLEYAVPYEVSGWRLEPVVGLTWFGVSRPAFAERGAEELDLLVDGDEAGWLRGRLDLRLSYPSGEGGRGFVPELRLGWVKDFNPPEREIQARLRGAQDSPFTVVGPQAGEDAMVIGGSLRLTTAREVTWQLEYDAQLWQDRSSHALRASVNARF